MRSSDSLISEKIITSAETTPKHFKSSLLSVDPILAFQRELIPISTFEYHFSFINSTIGAFLYEDTHADKLRALLGAFNIHAFKVVTDFSFALTSGRSFYGHDDAESIIDNERAQRLLDPKFQSKAKERAVYAAMKLECAHQVLVQEVLPRLPDIGKALKEYVDEYSRRHRIMQERSRSWIPSGLQDIIMGANDPTTHNISEVTVLPDDFDAGAEKLKKLPEFLSRMQAHFKELGELDMNQVGSLGYTTIQDLHRLYRDRLQCYSLLRIMRDQWDPALLSFPIPLPESK